jgi:hypothetical protein
VEIASTIFCVAKKRTNTAGVLRIRQHFVSKDTLLRAKRGLASIPRRLRNPKPVPGLLPKARRQQEIKKAKTRDSVS